MGGSRFLDALGMGDSFAMRLYYALSFLASSRTSAKGISAALAAISSVIPFLRRLRTS